MGLRSSDLIAYLRPIPTEESARSLRPVIIHWLMVVVVGLSAFGMVVTPFVSPMPVLGELLYGILLVASVGIIALVRAGKAWLGGPLWAMANYALLTIGVLTDGGVYSPAIAAIPVSILTAGLIWNGWAAAGITVASMLLTGGLVLVTEEPGVSGLPGPVDIWASLVVVLLSTLTLTQMALFLLNQALETSQRAERRLTAILEQSADGIVLTDDQGTVERVNPTARELFPAVEPGSRLQDRFESGLARRFEAVLTAARTGGARPTTEPLLAVLGPDTTLELITSIFEHDGRGVSVAIRDISARQRSEKELTRLHEQLVQAQKMELVGQLTSSFAHDFNNYLTVISGCATLAREEEDVSEAARTELDHVIEASGRAAQLARRMLDFGRKPVASDAIDARVVVGELAPLLTRLLGHDHHLVTHLAEPRPTEVDRAQLEVALTNLVVNARDASPEGATITVEVRDRTIDRHVARSLRPPIPAGDYVSIGVSDEGQGVAPDRVDAIFEPFVTSKPRGSGTGLGLPTVLRIVKAAGGAIRFESAVGQGTRVELLLPVAMADALALA